MQNIFNLTDQKKVHVSNIFRCYRVNFNGMRDAQNLGEKFKISEFALT